MQVELLVLSPDQIENNIRIEIYLYSLALVGHSFFPIFEYQVYLLKVHFRNIKYET